MPGEVGYRRLRDYQRTWLRGDLVGGITVAAYLVPQVMAYAEVAGLPPVTGLWSVIVAMVAYALIGSSRQLSMGPESTTALMTAAAVGPLAAGDPARYAALAAALAGVVGVLFLIAWLARLGFLADLLSKPVLVGYLMGVAVLMIVSQLDTVLGVELEGETTLAIVVSFLSRLGDAHLPTVLVAIVALMTLVIGARLYPKLPIPLMVMVLAAAVVAVLDLGADGVAVVGQVPAGLPSATVPSVTWSDLTALALPAIGVGMVAFTDNALTGRAFATRNGYAVDPRQELLALGAANLGVVLVQGFPVSSSGSRTAIGDSLGTKSQLFSLVAVAMVLVTLLFLGPLLASFPEAALAAVVVWAALKLIDLPDLVRIGRFRRTELALALATTAGVLLVGILDGVGIAVGLSILDLLRRVARPHDGVLGYVPGVAGMHDVDDYADAVQVPGLVVYRYDAPLFFANAEDFRRRVLEAVEETPDVEWLLLNFEANIQIDLTAIDALVELNLELARRGIVLALARVKSEMREELERGGLVDMVGPEHVFATLPTAVIGFLNAYRARHGGPPPGVTPPAPPEPPLIDRV
ncbi:MAG: sulfate permease [Actinobacteria bacterium]|nr:sulfate permease [Actinomycetota bacterium]